MQISLLHIRGIADALFVQEKSTLLSHAYKLLQ